MSKPNVIFQINQIEILSEIIYYYPQLPFWIAKKRLNQISFIYLNV